LTSLSAFELSRTSQKMVDTASASFTSFESTSDVLTTILEDGTCPNHPDEELNVFCYTDKSFMCLKCSITHKGHHITTFANADEGYGIIQQVTSTVFCAKHMEKAANYYCLKEDRPVCEMCCIVTCKNHEIEEIKDMATRCKDKLGDINTQIHSQVTNPEVLTDFLARADELKTKMESKEGDQLAKVDAYYADLRKKLDAKHQESIEYVKKEIRDVCGEMISFVNSMKQIQEWDTIHQKLIKSGDMELINYCRSEKMTDLEEFVQDFETCGEENLEMLKGEGMDDLGVVLDEKYNFSDLKLGFVGGVFRRNNEAERKPFYFRYNSSQLSLKEWDASSWETKNPSFSDSLINGRQVCAGADGALWIYGGTNTSGYTDSSKLHRYDLKNDKMTSFDGPKGQNGNAYFALVAAPDLSLYVIAGYYYPMGGQIQYYDQTHRYDIRKDSWEEIARLDTRLYYHTACCYTKRSQYMLYVIGGHNTQRYVSEVRVYNHNMKDVEFKQGKWELVTIKGGFNYNYLSRCIPLADHGKILIVSSGGYNSFEYHHEDKEIKSLGTSSTCSWSQGAFWSRKDNEVVVMGDNGSGLKYDIEKKEFKSYY